jgi:hypothetical protein
MLVAAYAGLGATDCAFMWLSRGLEEHMLCYGWAGRCLTACIVSPPISNRR